MTTHSAPESAQSERENAPQAARQVAPQSEPQAAPQSGPQAAPQAARQRAPKDVHQERRAYKRGSGRERVLDAYALVLREEGVSAATLDEVAKRADISKGGLLHHFASKEALVEGLMERLNRQNIEDIENTMDGDDGVTGYLQASMVGEDEYSATFMAVLKLAGSGNEVVDSGLREGLDGWRDALDSVIDNKVLARLIQLVGDGLYLHTLVGDAPDDIDRQVVDLAGQIVAERRP
ncbi:TetR/AcrR family transcriptional regulator [Timonella senegalensis]|uniref:TetR/AcrR family transcriptional regulator n=1 Tax=Timonella senegalensis TaxID=1465825 RepID=UPI0028AAD6F9|nr:TetR/AcrR family transcriptional regulator [Timonella senegalensis]